MDRNTINNHVRAALNSPDPVAAGSHLIDVWVDSLDAAERATKAASMEAPLGRAAALDRAKEMVDAASTPVTNARGYADGWKPPTLDERTTAVLRLAAFLSGQAGEL